MKATMDFVPQPQPPRQVTLAMTEDEARLLFNIACRELVIPKLLSEEKALQGRKESEYTRLLSDLYHALVRAGVM